MTDRHAQKIHGASVRGEQRCGPSKQNQSLSSGVRPYVIEMGQRIIEEEREFLERLEAYDRGERPKR